MSVDIFNGERSEEMSKKPKIFCLK
ncbi:hypothetical protein CGLO_14659 [Colletotrichum gloeosporioides Cg-14]|uniref:Uncharacterized protein n=1 Tax=Colletotrichum gloeosporioides (strain Cg-14) TaxID=1237896 RepID=T0LD86_COLGC|nr:hypothetical protein CGLO_14659 [Colletotrichum gloeosporioides Cg-14]